VAKDRIFEMVQDFGPGVEFDVMRVDIYDEIIIEVVESDVAMRVCEYFARIRARGDLLDFMFSCSAHTVDELYFAHRSFLRRSASPPD
jgi:hypothetical protein